MVDAIVITGGGQDRQTITVVDNVELTGILRVEDNLVPLEISIIGEVVMTTALVAHLLRIGTVDVVTIGTMVAGVVHLHEAVKTGMALLGLEMNQHCLCLGELQNKSRMSSSSL